MRRLLLLAMLLGLVPSAQAEELARRFLYRPAAEPGLNWYLGTLAPVALPFAQRTVELYVYLLDDGRSYAARIVELRESEGDIEVVTQVSAGIVWERPTARELVLGDLAVCRAATLGGRRGLTCRLTSPRLPGELRGETLGLGYLRAAKPAP